MAAPTQSGRHCSCGRRGGLCNHRLFNDDGLYFRDGFAFDDPFYDDGLDHLLDARNGLFDHYGLDFRDGFALDHFLDDDGFDNLFDLSDGFFDDHGLDFRDHLLFTTARGRECRDSADQQDRRDFPQGFH